MLESLNFTCIGQIKKPEKRFMESENKVLQVITENCFCSAILSKLIENPKSKSKIL